MKSRPITLTIMSGDEPERFSGPRSTKRDDSQSDGLAAEKNISQTTGVQQRKRIVIVDDEPNIRSMLQILLKNKGFDVTASLSDGIELVKLIDQIDPKPEVILLDERMPVMSGVDTCKTILGKYPEITIIFVSADESVERNAMQAGAKAFLKKPVSIPDLVALLSPP